jgi:hypothetical protein
MFSVYEDEISDGRYSLKCLTLVTLEGVQVYVGGGTRVHIGSVAVSQPRESLKGDGTLSCTTSVLNLLGHKDDSLAVPLAEQLCRHINQAVVVTAGVHIDDANPDEIERLLANCRGLGERILRRFPSPSGPGEGPPLRAEPA